MYVFIYASFNIDREYHDSDDLSDDSDCVLLLRLYGMVGHHF